MAGSPALGMQLPLSNPVDNAAQFHGGWTAGNPITFQQLLHNRLCCSLVSVVKHMTPQQLLDRQAECASQRRDRRDRGDSSAVPESLLGGGAAQFHLGGELGLGQLAGYRQIPPVPDPRSKASPKHHQGLDT